MDNLFKEAILGIGEQLSKEDSISNIFSDYAQNVDLELINLGWDFKGAKTVEYGKYEQSMINHVRNGVFFLLQLNKVLPGYDKLSENELREAIALFIAHDIHKTTPEMEAKDEFDISLEGIEKFVRDVGLDELAPTLDMQDFHSCAVAHHRNWNARKGRATIKFNELRPYIRIADSFASTPRPRDVVKERSQKAIRELGAGYTLRYHSLDDVKGIFTNILNKAISEVLRDLGYRLLTIYQNGCVYLVEKAEESIEIDESLIKEIYARFSNNVRESHPSFKNPNRLMDGFDRSHLGYYKINEQDFFYAGSRRVLKALVQKAIVDSEDDQDLTDAMVSGLEKVSENTGIDLKISRRVVGLARLVHTVNRVFIPNLVGEENKEGWQSDEFVATLKVFGFPDKLTETLKKIHQEDPKLFESGGKWEYSYVVAQHLIDSYYGEYPTSEIMDLIYKDLAQNLQKFNKWEELDDEFIEDIENELKAYVVETLNIDGERAAINTDLTDNFDEYTNTRGGKICTLCNRGTTSTRKSDMETPKSLSTLQSGFSNRVRVNAGKPEKLLTCYPCQIEFSLRNTGSNRRKPGRLFFHLMPDYFYTPFSWDIYKNLIDLHAGDTGILLNKLAESIFNMEGIETYKQAIRYMTNKDGGLSMIESLMQGFEPRNGFGAQTIGYYKPNKNETEFQFFGVFLGLVAATYAGMRLYISESPIPEIKAKDFKEMVKIGSGYGSIKRFYGDKITLDEMRSVLKTTAAIIRLGYAVNRKDSLFPKYLRVTRNKPLPGSYLLKRAATEDENSARYLIEEAKYLDINTGMVTYDRRSKKKNRQFS